MTETHSVYRCTFANISMIFTKALTEQSPGLGYKNYERGGHSRKSKVRVFCLNANHQKEPMGFIKRDKLTLTTSKPTLSKTHLNNS